MKKLFLASINIDKINESKLFKGKTGRHMNIAIWLSDEPDQYGNTISIEQSTEKSESKIYLGNGKEYKPQSDRVTQPKDDLPDFMK